MPPTLTICADCERAALRTPRKGRAMTEALTCLTKALLAMERLEDLRIVHESCLQNCPVGRICVALARDGRETRHHLSPGEDPEVVAAKLAGPAEP